VLNNIAVPKYVQLQNIIKDKIITKQYHDGDKIPSETELMETYSVTRTTIRKALSNLVYEGLLRKEQGRGTFVSFQDITHSMWNFSGFTDYAMSKERIPVSRVLNKGIIEVEGHSFFKLVRARGMETNLSVSWYTIDTSLTPLKLFKGIDKKDFSRLSLYNVMKKDYNIIPKTASLEVSAVPSTEWTREVLEYDQDVPLVRVKGSIYSDKNIEIEQVDVVYNPNVRMHIITNMEAVKKGL
jgi:GntR family transcriptional regulator